MRFWREKWDITKNTVDTDDPRLLKSVVQTVKEILSIGENTKFHFEQVETQAILSRHGMM